MPGRNAVAGCANVQRMTRLIAVAALILFSLPAGQARSHHRRTSEAQGPFDYYLLSLSWAPEFCAETNSSSAECSGNRHYGFILHGLWPEAETGSSPQHCSGPAFYPQDLPPGIANIMPSEHLIEHEWVTHGTCSGLSEREFFQTAQRAFQAVKIPGRYAHPSSQVEVTPAAIRHDFAAANAGYGENAFAVDDDRGYLREVRVCLTKALAPRACGHPGDTSNRTIVVRPVR